MSRPEEKFYRVSKTAVQHEASQITVVGDKSILKHKCQRKIRNCGYVIAKESENNMKI